LLGLQTDYDLDNLIDNIGESIYFGSLTIQSRPHFLPFNYPFAGKLLTKPSSDPDYPFLD
jgi:hypothetical protein